MRTYIKDTALSLIKAYDTKDPFKMLECLGVDVEYNYEFKNLKGCYIIINRQPFVVINGNLSSGYKKIIAAHELGHDRLHREFARNNSLQEFMMYDMRTRPEYEANIFAAELLLSDNETAEQFKAGYTTFEAARNLSTDVNLLRIKIMSMNSRGYSFNIDTSPSSDFLAKI